jgi:1-acyl-sn-glycerol-3-phosphate acyltransferase
LSSQFGLLTRRPFAPLFLTHLFGALNDHLILVALLATFVFQAASPSAGGPEVRAAIALCLFCIPFLILPGAAGQFGDKMDKAWLVRKLKLFEIAVALLAVASFAANSSALAAATLFLLGVRSSLFGPISYSTLAQQMQKGELVGANALMTSATFFAVFISTLAYTALLDISQLFAPASFVTLALMGYACSRKIVPADPPDPGLRINLRPLAEASHNFESLRRNRPLFLSVLGVSWFWFFCAAILAQILAGAGARDGSAHHLPAELIGLFALGFAIGAGACEPLSDRKVEIGLVPLGSIGLTLLALDLALAAGTGVPGQPSPDLGAASLGSRSNAWHLAADAVLLGLFGGLYLTPLNALIQARSDPGHRARTIAINSVVSAVFVAAAILWSAGLARAGLPQAGTLLALALLNAGVAIYIYRVVPEFLMRLIVWGLIHTFYKLRKSGLEHIPDEGAAVVVCNHVSFVDAVVISAACRRPIRFVTDHRIFAMPIVNFVFRVTRAIPIASPREDIELLRRAYAEISRALAAGEIVGIFPEGRITDSGEIAPFQNGIRRILDRNPVPVIPMALRGLWGSFFPRKDAPAMTRPLRRGLFNRIELVVAPAIPPDRANPKLLQQTVSQLRGNWK